MNAALGIIRRDGAERLSMRQLAKELHVTPMAIYYYFSNKDVLFERVADAVLARVPRPAPSGLNWREEMKTSALHGFRLLFNYPGLSAQIFNRPPSKQSHELACYGIEILMAAGIDARSAALATTICQAFMYGMIGVQGHLELARHAKQKVPYGQVLPEHLDVTLLASMGMDALLAGFEQMLPRSASPAVTPKRRTADRAKSPGRTKRRAPLKAVRRAPSRRTN